MRLDQLITEKLRKKQEYFAKLEALRASKRQSKREAS